MLVLLLEGQIKFVADAALPDYHVPFAQYLRTCAFVSHDQP
jgi:hypothetical protein